jgi:hypothetical protein
LLATQVTARVRHILDIDLPVAAIFDNPSLGHLAEAIDTALLADVEAMSDADIDRLLAAEEPAAEGPPAAAAEQAGEGEGR